ncbi:MFS transporter [Thermoproteota archaeon]
MSPGWEKRLSFYYGWVIFGITFLIYMFMYALRYSVGIFFEPIRNEFGWTNAMTASGVTIFFWTYAFSAPFIGQLARKIGVRRTVFFGGLLLGGGGVILSQINALWQLYLAWGVIASLGSVALYIVPTMVLSKFFIKKRGSAVGWSSMGVSAGQALIIPQIAKLIPSWGWRPSMLLLGIMVICTTSVLGWLFLRENPEELGLFPDGADSPPDDNAKGNGGVDWSPKEAAGNWSFRLIAFSYFFSMGGIISIMTFVVPHMINIGIPPIQASGAFGIIGVMSATGSFLFGFVSDRFGRKLTIIITTGLLAITFGVATVIPSDLTFLYAWTVLYGLSYGGAPEQYAAIVTDYFGTTHNTTLFGLVTLVGGIGGGLFPLLGGWLVDQTESYYATLLLLAVGMALAACIAFLTKEPKRL